MVRAAKPVGTHWAAAHGTICLIRSTLVVALGQLDQLEPLGLIGAVSISGGTVRGIGAAEPIGFRAAATDTGCFIRSTLAALGKLDQLETLSLIGAVVRSGSTPIVRTAVPVGSCRAATTGTPGLLGSTATGHAATRTGTLVRSALSDLGRFSLYLESSSHCQKSTQYNGSHFSRGDVFPELGLYQWVK